ncbi:3-oxoacid CoA-transferase subunit B [Microbacterium ulmi]|uniref:3-oxoacid CoA-transferase subunit B n=1 Tax=Microbacterium ulmi TaxID=179095 RepID=A0A7Y2Q038_9MICO|nr:3-oxoacid CoA-transferase subunit B [Microbacterium ulmi]NII68970.1 3-oxoacid CoA-transferase B subunit [Microbacterium ulmi]NNH03953.1 3-oxoacid CoA-transferase subunit B [Microbacterium ulmi]
MSPAIGGEAAGLLAADGAGWSREGVAERARRDLRSGSFVNLGIGIPQLVADFVEPEAEIYIHSENGIIGAGPGAAEGEEDADIVDAGKRHITLVLGASTFDSALSFAIMRGGHLDYSLLGGMEVACNGDLANWAAPGRTPGVGGAMDLVQGAKEVWVLLLHRGKGGESKMRVRCELPLTGAGVTTRVYTDLGVFEPAGAAFRVIERAPGVTRALLEEATEAPLEWPEPDA